MRCRTAPGCADASRWGAALRTTPGGTWKYAWIEFTSTLCLHIAWHWVRYAWHGVWARARLAFTGMLCGVKIYFNIPDDACLCANNIPTASSATPLRDFMSFFCARICLWFYIKREGLQHNVCVCVRVIRSVCASLDICAMMMMNYRARCHVLFLFAFIDEFVSNNLWLSRWCFRNCLNG